MTSAHAKTATYVYCLVAAPRRPALARVPRGLPGGGAVRLLEVMRGRWLVVADVPLARYGEAALAEHLSDLDWVARAAIAHEAVIECFAAVPALLPMKLFTMFANDERAAADFAARRPVVDALLKRVKNQHEWGVRLLMPARLDVRQPTGAKATRQPVSGAGYLSRKKAARDRAVELALRGRDEADQMFETLSARASAARRRAATESPATGGAVLLDAALLVPRIRAKAFQGLVARENRRLAPLGYQTVLTGPWPPFSFMET